MNFNLSSIKDRIFESLDMVLEYLSSYGSENDIDSDIERDRHQYRGRDRD